MTEKVSLWQIFSVFAKVGAFTIGGGYAMIPVIQREMVSRGWMTDEELPDIVALAQSAPGVLAVNMSIFAGYRLRGFKGSIAATLGAITPSFLIILAVAMLFANFKDSPIVISVFKGIRPAVVALIAVPMIRMARKNNHSWWSWCICAASLLAVALLKFSPIYILTVIFAAALGISLFRQSREAGK